MPQDGATSELLKFRSQAKCIGRARLIRGAYAPTNKAPAGATTPLSRTMRDVRGMTISTDGRRLPSLSKIYA